MIFNTETRCTCDEVVRLAEAEGRAAKRSQEPARTQSVLGWLVGC